MLDKMLRDELFYDISCLFLTGIIGGGGTGASGKNIPGTMRVAIGETMLLAADAERHKKGHTRCVHMMRAANKKRDRETWKAGFAGYSGKDFRRRFKISKTRF